MSIFVNDEGFVRLRDMLMNSDEFPFSSLVEFNSAFSELGFDILKKVDVNSFMFSKNTEEYFVQITINGKVFNNDGNRLDSAEFEYDESYFTKNSSGGYTLVTDVTFAVYED